MSLVLPQAGSSCAKGHALTLTMGRETAQVRLSGELDIAAATDLDQLMRSLDLVSTVTVEVDLRDVTFVDSAGIGPLVEAARRRTELGLPPVLIGGCSPSARLLMRVAGLDGEPYLNIPAWDRLAWPAEKRHG